MFRLITALLLFTSVPALSCDINSMKDLDQQKKFIKVVEGADFAFIGKVIRLYRVPDTPASFDHFNGYVFEITETIAGTQYTHMEAEQMATCGVNTADDKSYWPQEFGEEFVVTGITKNDIHYIQAVIPVEESLDVLYDIAQIARHNEKLRSEGKVQTGAK